MTTPLTAFPADGYTARWGRLAGSGAGDGPETVQLRWENEGWTVTGDVSAERVTYVMRMSASWQVRQFLLFRDLDEPDLWLGTDGSARWGEMNGAHRPDLDGCFDVDLAITPFTNTLPIRRLLLDVGDAADIATALIDVTTLGVVPVRQRYHRIGERRFARTDLTSGAEVLFDVDEYGLVNDYDGVFHRI